MHLYYCASSTGTQYVYQSEAQIGGSNGGIAQLGERLHGMQEVSGSIPLTSTKKLDKYTLRQNFLKKFHQNVVKCRCCKLSSIS